MFGLDLDACTVLDDTAESQCSPKRGYEYGAKRSRSQADTSSILV